MYASGGAGSGVALPVGATATANARIDVGSLELYAVVAVYGKACFAFLNEFLGPDAEADDISRKSETTKKTGAFSDKGITYYIAQDGEEENREDMHRIYIDFLTKDSDKSVGTITIYLSGEKAELSDINSTYTQYRGAGTRMMTVFEDIAYATGYDTVVLKSLRTAVGFYVGLEHPYNFVRPENGDVYREALPAVRAEGPSERNARKAAAKTFVVPGKVNLIPMTKTLKKRHRKNKNYRRRTRSLRSKK